MRRSFFPLGLCGILLALLPATAQAHLVETNYGPIYDGLCHPFVTPTDLLIVLALSLLAGHAGPSAGRATLFSLTVSWLAGSVIGHTWLSDSFKLPVVAAAGGNLLVGLLVTANVKCPRWMLAVLGAVFGLSFGLSSGAEFGSLREGPLVLAGSVTSVFVVTSWVTSLAIKSDHGARRIVVRVAGSWIAAASLLMIGWELRNPPAGANAIVPTLDRARERTE